MAKKPSVYVDTGAFIAFLDKSDTYHSLFAHLFADPPGLISTLFVIAEGQGWFLKRYDSYKALQFMSFIEELKPLIVLDIQKEEMKGASSMLRHFSDQNLTLADACGLWLMKKMKIKTCWGTDRHLTLTGASLCIYE